MRTRLIVTLLLALLLSALHAPSALAEAKVPLGHVEIRGEGPVPMVLLSGPALDWRCWDSFMDRNKEAYTMYAVSLPGMSGSEPMPMPRLWRPASKEERKTPPMGTPWLDNAIEAIVDMMHEQGVDQAVIMGHSLGGQLAMRLAIEHPELVSAVITLEGPVVHPHARPMTLRDRAEWAQFTLDQRLRQVEPKDWAPTMKEWTYLGTSDADVAKFVTDVSLDTEREVMIRYMVEQQMMDLSKPIDNLKAPLLGIFTSEPDERFRTVDVRKRMDFEPAWHEDVRFYDYGEYSYFYNLQLPDRFDAEIAGFLADQGLAGNDDEQGDGH